MIINNNKIKEEFSQVYVRYFIMLTTAVFIAVVSPSLFKREVFDTLSLSDLYILDIISNTVYFAIIKYTPSFLNNSRIYIQAFIDIFLTAMALVCVGSFSVYFPSLLLWYIVGYSSRYDIKVAVFTIINTLFAWTLVIYFSDFWIYHLDIATGWFFAFLILPLYFLKVLYKLNNQYRSLYQNYNETQEGAKYDFLTNLINRSHFEKELDVFISKSIYTNHGFTLMFVDLDGFKKVNDILGHDIGDEILIEVANRLKIVTNSNDVIARLGGDEFTIIIPTTNKEQIIKKASNITMILSKPYSNDINHLSASIGIAMFPQDAHLKTLLKKHADMAMYEAKQNGKNRFVFYSDIAKI
jgi:diguanylate cyclase (GGDEF)-like protein